MIKLALIFLMLSTTARAEKNICYFSLNNQKEFKEMEKLTQKLNLHSKEKITIHEHLAENISPEESFKKMVASGVKCDGLVISGHHTGSFSGKQASGSLGIDFIEKLSCDSKYQQWFSNISAVWLQGCRTLGMKIETNGTNEQQTSDFQTNRVGGVLEEDSIEASFAELNMEFSATLDQENPLSSRYLRVFPRATVFGWTATAPGQNAHSEFSIPYHIAHVARLNDDRAELFTDPTKELNPETAVKYASAITQILGRLDSKSESCSEAVMVEGWLEHGQATNKIYPFSFDNKDLMAFHSLTSTQDVFLKKARELDCLMKKELSDEELLAAVDAALTDEKTLGYSFNAIWELLQRQKKEGNFLFLKKIQDKLKASEVLKHFIMQKLANRELGIVRKIDYYSFFTEITGERNDKVEDLIRSAAMKIFVLPNPEQDFAFRDFKQTLAQSLMKNKLFDKKFLDTYIREIKDQGNLLLAIELTKESDLSSKEKLIALKAVMDHPKFGSDTVETFAESTWCLNHTDKATLLSSFLDKKNQPSSRLVQIARVMDQDIRDDHVNPNPETNFSKILSHPNGQTDEVLSAVAEALGTYDVPPKNSVTLLKKIQASPGSKTLTNNALVEVNADGKLVVPNSQALIQKLLHSKNTSDLELYKIASAIQYSKASIEHPNLLLEEILKHPKSENLGLAGVLHASYSPQLTSPQKEKLLSKVLKSKYINLEINQTMLDLEIRQSKPSYIRMKEALKWKDYENNDLLLFAVKLTYRNPQVAGDLEILKILEAKATSSEEKKEITKLRQYSSDQILKAHP